MADATPPAAKSRIFHQLDFDRPGKQIGYLRVPQSRDGGAWSTIEIPIAIVNGSPGPRVLFTGGVHGDEYEGQIAVSRLARRLDPQGLRGRVILMPAVDLPAALAYRLVAAVAELAARLGVPDAPISYRPFEGYLAIQLWLGRQPLRGDVREVATAVLERVRTKATDMASAQLDVLVMWLPSEVLVSEEEEEEDNDTEGDSMVMQEFSPSNHVEPDGASDFLIADPGSEA